MITRFSFSIQFWPVLNVNVTGTDLVGLTSKELSTDISIEIRDKFIKRSVLSTGQELLTPGYGESREDVVGEADDL